ncbi:MAG TPA: hypothetical protein VGK73_09005 [Polyangiaceae bacterium]
MAAHKGKRDAVPEPQAMRCNLIRPRPMTLREAKEIAGFRTEYPNWKKPRGMSDAQFAKWTIEQKAKWDADQETLIGVDHEPMFICGNLKIPTCRCGFTSEYLCDFPTGDGKTCDAELCSRCKRSIGEDHDLCLVHHAMFMGRESIGEWPPRNKS